MLSAEETREGSCLPLARNPGRPQARPHHFIPFVELTRFVMRTREACCQKYLLFQITVGQAFQPDAYVGQADHDHRTRDTSLTLPDVVRFGHYVLIWPDAL